MDANQALIDAIRVNTRSQDGITLPPGYKFVPDDFTRVRSDAAQVEAHTLRSLVDYVERYADGREIVFASEAQIRAIIDYGDPENAEIGNANHTATFRLTTTEEWRAWQGISGRPLPQREFAEFIEEHLESIHSPPAADVLTVATTLNGKRNIQFTQVADLANGDKSIAWEEKTDAKAAGDVRVPSRIVLRIPIFEGAEMETTYDIAALFRYRIADGKLTYEVKLLHVDRMLKQAFERVVEQLQAMLPDSSCLIVGKLAADRDFINREKTTHKN
jgi:uncharacterized protein YfdQ (DUF2303 family)